MGMYEFHLLTWSHENQITLVNATHVYIAFKGTVNGI